MPDVGAGLRGAVVTAGATALLAASPAVPAPGSQAAAAEARWETVESIPAYDVVLTIGTDAVLYVRETITYDFDSGGEHGIVRQVPYRHGDRLLKVGAVRASSSTGAPARARTVRLFNDVRITVGERGRLVTGRQAYVIEYSVTGAFTPRQDRDELVWDAIGPDWGVPIGEAAVRVVAPVPLRRASCYAGRHGAQAAGTRCLRFRDGPYALEFTQRGLGPGEGMMIKVRLPKGAVPAPPPQFAPPRWRSGWTGTAVLGLTLGAAGLTARRIRRGRRFPGPGTGEALVTCGMLVILADLAEDVVPHGPWAFALGDPSLAGLAAMIVGAGVEHARKVRRKEDGASVLVEDYS